MPGRGPAHCGPRPLRADKGWGARNWHGKAESGGREGAGGQERGEDDGAPGVARAQSARVLSQALLQDAGASISVRHGQSPVLHAWKATPVCKGSPSPTLSSSLSTLSLMTQGQEMWGSQSLASTGFLDESGSATVQSPCPARQVGENGPGREAWRGARALCGGIARRLSHRSAARRAFTEWMASPMPRAQGVRSLPGLPSEPACPLEGDLALTCRPASPLLPCPQRDPCSPRPGLGQAPRSPRHTVPVLSPCALPHRQTP